MFRYTQVLLNAFNEKLNQNYLKAYGEYKSQYREIINWAAGLASENIATGDALYHNLEHTIYVTLVGQEIMRGQHIRAGGVSCEDWLHFSISLLCHDIGYVKGVCSGDDISSNTYATGVGEEKVVLSAGASGASLTPYHVDRGKLFIAERFGHKNMIDAKNRWGESGGLDVEIIQSNIELSRFPVPEESDFEGTASFPALLRAADLIGQLSDPRYLNKIIALFYEFEETGTNKKLGYQNPSDLANSYPKFFWNIAYRFMGSAIQYLKATEEGRDILANLYSQVFVMEHEL